jgi:hypothetical protein
VSYSDYICPTTFRTGIDDNGIGLLTFCGSAMAPLSQHGFDGLCFVLIDLTAKS